MSALLTRNAVGGWGGGGGTGGFGGFLRFKGNFFLFFASRLSGSDSGVRLRFFFFFAFCEEREFMMSVQGADE